MRKTWAGLGLAFLVAAFLLAAQDRSKKVYELIYEDIQVLKKQLLAIEERQGRDAAEIRLLKEQMREFQNQIKALQKDQTGLQQGLQSIPSQYQFLLDKIDQMNLTLARIAEDLLLLKSAPTSPPTAGPPPTEKPSTAAEKKAPEKKKEALAEEPKPVGPPPSLSPQDVYNTAYSDYLQGNFDLAVDGFKIYRENFPESPLADNALYWIGECAFSQGHFEAAIEHFNDLILNYPQSDKIAAAYLKKGLALAELGKKEEAVMVLKLLMGKYPLEEEARIAQAKIKDLMPKDERHQ